MDEKSHYAVFYSILYSFLFKKNKTLHTNDGVAYYSQVSDFKEEFINILETFFKRSLKTILKNIKKEFMNVC